MKLIIGGAYQGKQKAAQQLFGLAPSDFLDGASCLPEDIFKCRGLNHFHELIRRLLSDGKESQAKALPAELLKKNPELILISTELGYGIVPVEPFDRLYRESVGRILCEIAGQSDEVYRVIAGIPVCIKGKRL